MKHRAIILSIPLLVIAILSLTNNTFSYFTAQATSENNIFTTAEVFPTPTDIPSTNPCDNINVSINGNGVGSYNGVVIICKNFKVVNQSNNTEINNEINVESNTGNNEINGNTGGENNIETGNASTTIIINTEGDSNQNNPTPTVSPEL